MKQIYRISFIFLGLVGSSPTSLLANTKIVSNDKGSTKAKVVSPSRLVAVLSSGKGSIEAYPSSIFQCQDVSDCATLTVRRGQIMAVNKKHLIELQKLFPLPKGEDRESSQQAVVANSICRKNLCELSGAGADQAEKSVSLWQDRCPRPALDLQRDELPEDLRPLVLKLSSELGWERQQALVELGQRKEAAEKVLPWVLNQLKNRENLVNTQDGQCILGSVPAEELYVEVIGKLDPAIHHALPLYLAGLQDKTFSYRHSEILRQLQRIGVRAAPATNQLIEILKEAQAQSWQHELALPALNALGAIGKAAEDELPQLLKWLEASSPLKGRLFFAMTEIDPASEYTKKAAVHLLTKSEEPGLRSMALHFMVRFPEELADHLETLKRILGSSELTSVRLGVLRVARSLGPKAKPLMAEVIKLGLKSREDLRRQAALALKSIDPAGQLSLATIKKRVYEGFPIEAQYLWKVMDTPLTRLELFKSHYYFVTGQRIKFADLQISKVLEKPLLTCLESDGCAQRTSALAALSLSKSTDERLPALLLKVMESPDASLRWEASGAFLLLYGEDKEGTVDATVKEKALAKAWALQEEALQSSAALRNIDLEDLMLVLGKKEPHRFRFVLKNLARAENTAALDGLLLLASSNSEGARHALGQLLQNGDRDRVISILGRIGLHRQPVGPWFKSIIHPLVNHGEPSIQEAAVLDKLLLQ